MRQEDVIRRPIISEKSTMIKRIGNQYIFVVDMKANKYQIAEAVKNLFGVKVESVNTSIVPGHTKRFGRMLGRVNKWKKAIVTLERGEKIEFFEQAEEAGTPAEA